MVDSGQKVSLRLYPTPPLPGGCVCGPMGCGPGSCGPGGEVEEGPSPDERFLELMELSKRDFGSSIDVRVASYAALEDLSRALEHLGRALDKSSGVRLRLTT